MIKFKLNKKYIFLLLTLSLVLFSSCSSIGGYVNGKTLNKKEFGPPETHTLMFGHMDVEEAPLHLPVNNTAKDYQEYIQMNPEKEPLIFLPIYFQGSVMSFYPMEPGVNLRLMFSRYSIMRFYGNYTHTTVYQFWPFLGWPESSTLWFSCKKPGLQYIGSYIRTKSGYKKDMEKDSAKNELSALEGIKEYYKGTSWESVIEKRIEELQNEKSN